MHIPQCPGLERKLPSYYQDTSPSKGRRSIKIKLLWKGQMIEHALISHRLGTILQVPQSRGTKKAWPCEGGRHDYATLHQSETRLYVVQEEATILGQEARVCLQHWQFERPWNVYDSS